LDKIRTNADQTPSAAKKETERGEEKRDANGRFAKRIRPGPGRPPGSRNKISKAFKEVLRDLGEGIDVTFKDPATDTLVEGPVAHLLAQPLVAGLTDPKYYAAFVKMILEYDISQQKTQSEVGPEHRRQTPKMVFLNERRPDGQAGRPTEATPDPGQIAGPNGEIIDAMTRRVMVPAPRKSVPGDTPVFALRRISANS